MQFQSGENSGGNLLLIIRIMWFFILHEMRFFRNINRQLTQNGQLTQLPKAYNLKRQEYSLSFHEPSLL